MSNLLFSVRLAETQDLTSLVQLEESAISESSHYRGSAELLIDAPLIKKNDSNVLNSESQMILVIEHDNSIQGYAQVLFSQTVATIQRIFISDYARNLGAGSQLLGAIHTECKRKGLKRLDAYALPGDRLTKNLFERAEMKARLLIASTEL